jgi:hypothetical protein
MGIFKKLIKPIKKSISRATHPVRTTKRAISAGTHPLKTTKKAIRKSPLRTAKNIITSGSVLSNNPKNALTDVNTRVFLNRKANRRKRRL